MADKGLECVQVKLERNFEADIVVVPESPGVIAGRFAFVAVERKAVVGSSGLVDLATVVVEGSFASVVSAVGSLLELSILEEEAADRPAESGGYL